MERTVAHLGWASRTGDHRADRLASICAMRARISHWTRSCGSGCVSVKWSVPLVVAKSANLALFASIRVEFIGKSEQCALKAEYDTSARPRYRKAGMA